MSVALARARALFSFFLLYFCISYKIMFFNNLDYFNRDKFRLNRDKFRLNRDKFRL